jgi:hypothetical protein
VSSLPDVTADHRHFQVYLDILWQLSSALQAPAALQALSEPHKFKPPHT